MTDYLIIEAQPFDSGDLNALEDIHAEWCEALYDFGVMIEHMEDQMSRGKGTAEEREKARKLMRDL